METGIIVCGCNGSGKSTLGKELAAALQYNFIDIEDCYFPKGNKDYIYEHARSYEEAKQVLIPFLQGLGRYLNVKVFSSPK